MGKMIASYDALTAQEEQYVQLIQKIVVSLALIVCIQ